MKGGGRRKRTWIIGAIFFFLLIAFIIQVAVMIFDAIEEHTQNKGMIALSMLAVIVVLAAVCTLIDVLRRKYTEARPLEKILQATEELAKGDFSVRLESSHAYGHYDSYDLIMENLNVMAAELGKSELLKTDFISNVSHELKTPLTVIKSYAKLLEREDLEEESRAKYAKAVQSAALRLNDLITNILRLNKLENQEIQPELERFDLGELLAETALTFEEKMEERGLEFACDLEENLEMYSSKSYLEIVVSNLLSNAVKFTDEGGMVALKLKRVGNKAVVTVSDTGCGISQETGARMFEKFYQGDTSHAEEGNGLGLALVKKVVDVLGGEIVVESEIGKGTTFQVALQL